MWLLNDEQSKENDKKPTKVVKDVFGNDIGLDSNGNVILKDYSFDFETLFHNEVKKIPITDKEFLKRDSLRATRLLNETNAILQSSPYKSYKPIYLDPTSKTSSNHRQEFQAFRNLYLKDPIKGAIAPWTKKEKFYYESLKTKRERVKYLMIRSGLRSAVIDIPFDAYCGVNEKGELINKDYQEIYAIVHANKGLAHVSDGYLALQEWNLAAGLLGDMEALNQVGEGTGFKARAQQAYFLMIQIGSVEALKYFGSGLFASTGVHENLLRQKMCENLAKKPPLDKFKMMPYIDEIIGVDWIMDFSQYDVYDDIMFELDKNLINGKLLDPRDPRSTKETKREFRDKAEFLIQRRVEASILDCPYLPTFENPRLEYDILVLYAKIRSITPPQGYPNAPYYYIPEFLDELYQSGKLDKKLNPTIPAIFRESFPQQLLDKIEWYAKKHGIKE